jgi:hypothetical protein
VFIGVHFTSSVKKPRDDLIAGLRARRARRSRRKVLRNRRTLRETLGSNYRKDFRGTGLAIYRYCAALATAYELRVSGLIANSFFQFQDISPLI